jgi:Integrase
MGAKSQANRSVHAANNQLGGAIATRVHRKSQCKHFLQWCFDNGYPVANLKAIKQPAVVAYFEYMLGLAHTNVDGHNTTLSKPVSNSTLHNYLGSIRRALSALQVDPDALGITAQAVGLAPKSRIGKKLPITDERFHAALAKAYAMGHPGIAIALKLERYLGHRGQEAIMSTTELKRFALECQSLLSGQLPAVTISAGTKGGRVRQVAVIAAYATETMHTIAETLHYVSLHGHLIKGAAPSLKSARSAYHQFARKIGLIGAWSPHSLRYRYCVDKLVELNALGVPRSEALRVCAEYLGHGPSRGRFVTMVYGRTVEAQLPKTRMRQDYKFAASMVDKWLKDSECS